MSSYFKNLGKQVKATAKRESSAKAALRAHPHSALMQVAIYLQTNAIPLRSMPKP
jgi:hypothetical protein